MDDDCCRRRARQFFFTTNMTIIQTSRLELVPFGAEFLRASLAGDSVEAERLLGAKLPAGWPDVRGSTSAGWRNWRRTRRYWGGWCAA